MKIFTSLRLVEQLMRPGFRISRLKSLITSTLLVATFLPSVVFAQSKVTLNYRNTALSTVMESVSKQSDYKFFFSDNIDPQTKVSVDMSSSNISEVMAAVLKGTDISFELSDTRIVLLPKALKEATDKQNAPATRTIAGTVKDEAGEKIIGATVHVKGTGTATVTNAEGRFSLRTSQTDPVLSVTYIGYDLAEVPVGTRTSVDIVLSSATLMVDELVVVGYGVQKKSSVTGAVSTVKGSELTIAPLASTTNTLAGRLPGLVTKQESGLPGSDGAKLSIRGFDAPLVIVDGVEGDFNTIDANEIESISILKDASAAIYGVRAGNGVILVTTKRGTFDKPTITFNGSTTFQGPANLMRMASAGQYSEMVREAHIQSGQPEATSRFTLEDIAKYYSGTDPDYPSTDWFDYLIRDWAPQQQYNLSLRGGNETVKFYGFFGYLNQESMIKRNGGDYARYNIRSNLDAKILSNLSMSVDISSIIGQHRFPWRSDEGENSVWQDIWNTEPIYPSSLPDPEKVPYANGAGTGGAHISSNRDLSGTRDSDNYSTSIKASMQWDINQLPGLSAKAMFVYDKSMSDWKYFQYLPNTYTYNYAADSYTLNALSLETMLNQSASKARTMTGQASLNYANTFAGKHYVSGLVLYEVIDIASSWLAGERVGFDSKSIPYMFAGGLKNQEAGSSGAEMGRLSLVGRANYSYDQKYFLEAAFRYDGSARFDEGYQWGLFPSLSAGWRISKENFMQGIKNTVSNLKLRGGYSNTGYDGLVNFAYLSGYTYTSPYLFGNEAKLGLNTTGLANPDLSWEEMTIYNVGLDFGFFRDKLYGEFDVFYRDRTGIQATRNNAIPDTFGATLPYENLNSINTRGFEVMLGYKGITPGRFMYQVSGNISWARSKYGHYEEPAYTDPDDIRINKKSGKWTDLQWGYRSNGLFTSREQIDQLNYLYLPGSTDNSHLNPGDVVLLDDNGDGQLNWRDQVQIGKGSMPLWMAGLNIDLSYKNFDLSMLFQGAFGFTSQVVLKRGTVYPEVVYKERWSEYNNDAKAIVPRLGGNSSNDWASDYNFVNGDYVRLKTLSLGYSFPSKILQRAKIGSLRVYVAGTNLFTASALTKYSIDPEAASGAGGYYYPQMRTITLGLNISL